MPQLASQGTTKKVVLPSTKDLAEPEQAWVVIQTGRILGGDTVNVDDPESQMGVALSILSGRIKEWNFTEADGKPTPITLDNVKRLELDDMNYLFGELDLKNAVSLSTEEKKSSLTSSEPTPTA